MSTFMREYQLWTRSTAVYPKEYELGYLGLGLSGEAGEVANEIKKVYRDNNGVVTPEREDRIIAELGDVLWYLSRIADKFGYSIEDVASCNRQKIKERNADEEIALINQNKINAGRSMS